MSLINSYISLIPDGQRLALQSLLKQDIPNLSDKDLETVVLDLLSKTDGPLFKSKNIDPDEIIQPEFFNRIWRSILADLTGLYTQYGALENTLKKHIVLNTSSVEKTKQALVKLRESFNTFSLLQSRRDINDIKIHEFVNGINRTKILPPAIVDSEEGVLISSLSSTKNKTKLRGPSLPSIDINILSEGISGQTYSSETPNKILDSRSTTFWSDVLLTDLPIKTNFPLDSANSFDGVIYQIVISLKKAAFINTIKFLPLTIFPVKIIDISLSDGSLLFIPDELKDSFGKFKNFKPSVDWQVFRIKKTFTKDIIITVQQQHFTFNIRHIDKRLSKTNDFWAKMARLINSSVIDEQTLTRSDLEDRFINKNNKLYQEALIDLSKTQKENQQSSNSSKFFLDATIQQAQQQLGITNRLQLESDITAGKPKDNSVIEIRKYEYQLGVKCVELLQEEYRPVSYYESPRFKLQGLPIAAQLEVDEQLPISLPFKDPHSRVSTEYSVEFAPGVIVPIVPLKPNNKTVSVITELLLFSQTVNGFVADTRFNIADLNTVVFRINNDTVLSSDFNIVGNRITILNRSLISPSFVYTLEYLPNNKESIINFMQFPSNEISETFNKTGSQAQITLKGYPFIINEIIHNTSSWIKEDPLNSIWKYRSGRGVINIGNMFFGELNGTAAAVSSFISLSIDISSGLNPSLFVPPPVGFVKIDNEIIKYVGFSILDNGTWYHSNPLSGPSLVRQHINTSNSVRLGTDPHDATTIAPTGTNIFRGQKGTTEQTTFNSTNINWVLDQEYEPISIVIDGIKASNITNYLAISGNNPLDPTQGGQPTFSITPKSSNTFQYIHSGHNIYFNKVLNNQEIVITYNKIVDFLKVRGVLYNNEVGRKSLTPSIKSVRVLLSSNTQTELKII